MDAQEGIVCSRVFAAPNGGFSESDIELLRRLLKLLAAVLKSLTQKRLVTDILNACLGDYPAE